MQSISSSEAQNSVRGMMYSRIVGGSHGIA